MSAAATGPGTIRVARSEYKYHVRFEQIAPITKWLASYCVPDALARGEWTPVRTLYLDTSDFRLYRESKETLPFRLKLRVRGYGDASGKVKLEIKRNVRGLIVKKSAVIKAEDWSLLATRGMGHLYEIDSPSANEFLQLVEILRAEPAILVYYERKAFSSVVDHYVRVTFDCRIQGQRMRAWDLRGSPKTWMPLDAAGRIGERDSPCVLEIKFLDSPPAWLRDLVLRFHLERRGFSKYCQGVERTAMHREDALDSYPGMWGGAE